MTRFEIVLRSKLRKAGITRWLRPQGNLRRALHRQEYRWSRPARLPTTVAGHTATLLIGGEQEYLMVRSKVEDHRLVGLIASELRPGDTYWDVGSSLGFYAVLVGRMVGPSGRVVAFEPEPRSRERLLQNVAENSLSDVVQVEPVALGSGPGSFQLAVAASFLDGSHKVVSDASHAGGRDLVEVTVAAGDALVAERGWTVPAVIKVDVEGAELDVFAGLARTLEDRALRMVLCEVHFAQLEERGIPMGPLEVEKRLRAAGFSRLEWPDASHLVARR
jgi:FkbM family methyltransferase